MIDGWTVSLARAGHFVTDPVTDRLLRGHSGPTTSPEVGWIDEPEVTVREKKSGGVATPRFLVSREGIEPSTY